MENKCKNKCTDIVMLILLAVIAVCSICITIKVYQINPETLLRQDTGNDSSVNLQSDANTYIELYTPYGSLLFPKEFEQYLETDVMDQDGVYSIKFSYKNNSEKMELYTVIFGDQQQGQLFGFFGSNISFSIQFAEYNENVSAWTDEDMFRVSAMREAVNDIINSVKSFDNYVQIK